MPLGVEPRPKRELNAIIIATDHKKFPFCSYQRGKAKVKFHWRNKMRLTFFKFFH